MKTVIAGSRSIADAHLIPLAIKLCGWEITEVVCGMAPGVDMMGYDWAVARGIHVEPFPAKWSDLTAHPCKIGVNRLGKQYNILAGHNRNLEMAGYAEALIAIWDGRSPGTRHMISAARGRGLKVAVFKLAQVDGADGAPATTALTLEPEPTQRP